MFKIIASIILNSSVALAFTSFSRYAVTNDTAMDKTLISPYGSFAAFNSSSINGVDVDLNGKLLVAGTFTSYRSVATYRIARINADGTRDTTFSAGSGPNTAPNVVKALSNGKTLIAGNFTNFNGVGVGRIALLNTDGTLDTAFNTNIGTGFSGEIKDVGVFPNGKILVVGLFNSFNGSATFGHSTFILNADGTPDASYNNSATIFGDGIITKALILDNTSFLLALSSNTSYNYNLAMHYGIVKFNTDGSMNTSQNWGLASISTGDVLEMTKLSSGKILISGSFAETKSPENRVMNRVAIFNSDGSLDTTMGIHGGIGASFGVNGSVSHHCVDPSGRIILSGSFTTANGQSKRTIVRLTPAGAVDSTFSMNDANFYVGISSAFSSAPNKLSCTSDGFYALGGFLNFKLKNVGSSGLIRVKSTIPQN